MTLNDLKHRLQDLKPDEQYSLPLHDFQQMSPTGLSPLITWLTANKLGARLQTLKNSLLTINFFHTDDHTKNL